MRMEHEKSRSSSDLGLSLGFQDFQFDICEQCKILKQELKKLQDEHALNYSTLKKKIISTDLLIKKYKAKCDDYDAQSKRHEEFFRKYEELQRESETLNAQLGSTLQQLEPLRKAKAALETDNKQKQAEVQCLKDKLTGCELAVRQYEEMTKESSTYKDRYDMLKKENQRKVQNLDAINQKNESVINKLKDENRNLRSENSTQLRKQRKLEEKLKRAVEKLDRYWVLLRQNGLLPKGEKKIISEKYLDVSGDFSVSQDEEEEGETKDDDDGTQPFVQDETSNDSDNFPWIFSPLVQALSPLPPSPMPCRMNKSLMGNAESDEENIDEMADLLESELLKSSPVRQPAKSQSLLRKVQTRSPLIERKQKQKISVLNKTKSEISNNLNNNHCKNDVESLSDSDSENISGNCKMKINSENVSYKDNGERIIDIESERPEGDISKRKGSIDCSGDKKVERSEHSAFDKFKPKEMSEVGLVKSKIDNSINKVNSSRNIVCLEAFPDEPLHTNVTTSDIKSESSVLENINLTRNSTSRKIDFINKSVDNSDKFESISNKEIKEMSVENSDLGSEEIDLSKENEEKKDSAENGFDLDDMVYDNYGERERSVQEVCATPNFDNVAVTDSKDNGLPPVQNNDICKSNIDANSRSNIENTQADDLKENKKLIQETSGESLPTSDRLSRNIIRQVSSGFILKSPPCSVGNDFLRTSLSPASHLQEDTQSISQNSASDKVSSNSVTELNKQHDVQSTISHEFSDTETCVEHSMIKGRLKKQQSVKEKRRGENLPHQESFGFKVDSENPVENMTDNGDIQIEVTNSENGNNIESNSCMKEVNKSSNTVQDDKKIISENVLLKEKYFSFIEKRRSSQNIIESTEAPLLRSEKDNLNKEENLKAAQKSLNKVEHHEKGNSKNMLDLQNTDIINRNIKQQTSSKTVKDTAAKNQVSEQKKTLHQLVLHGLETKIVPSSAVISPEISSLSKQFEQRPKSQNSLHSESPHSPFTMSSFDFSIPMLLSPLPPSPARTQEPVSPLPGSPWVDDNTSRPNSCQSSPINISKAFPKKRANRPCSFSSDVPSHAIHVKPLSACKTNKTNSASSKTTENMTKTVPAERDPLGRKQRVSRVPKQAVAQKRKSLEPISNDIKDKKKCHKDEVTATVKEKVEVKQEVGYWKDVEIYLQQYISIYDMTPEDVQVKLLTDKEVTAVLPAVVLWTTQYLRSSEAEMLNNIYKFCNGEEDAKPGPFLTVQEVRLVDLLVHIIQKNIWEEFKTRLLDALWNSIMLKDVVTVLGRTALCRVFTAVCQKEGNLDYVRVLFYHIVTSGFTKFITLGLSISGVWPQVLYKSDEDPSRFIITLEFCIMRILLADKEKHEKLIVCFSALCNWSKPKKMESVAVLKQLIHDLQAVTRHDESLSEVSDKQFELYKSLELLLLTEDNQFFKRSFTMACLNQMFQKIKTNNALMNGGLPVSYIKCIINVTAIVLSRKMDWKYSVKNISKFMFGLLSLATVTTDVQEVVANAMLDIAYIAPMPVFSHLTQWYMKEQRNISAPLKHRLETTRNMLIPHEGKLTSFSFK